MKSGKAKRGKSRKHPGAAADKKPSFQTAVGDVDLKQDPAHGQNLPSSDAGTADPLRDLLTDVDEAEPLPGEDYFVGDSFETLLERCQGGSDFLFADEKDWLSESCPSAERLDLKRLSRVLSRLPVGCRLGFDVADDFTQVKCSALDGCDKCGVGLNYEQDLLDKINSLSMGSADKNDRVTDSCKQDVSNGVISEDRDTSPSAVEPAPTSQGIGNDLLDNDWLDDVLADD